MLKDRMTLILYYDENTSFIYDICNREILGVIDNNSSLIRYLLDIMELNNVRLNDSKYLTLRNKKGIVTTLQRLIVEFYSRYDVKLRELLDNGYEINHINKNKLDNRLSNLEVVSHMDNIKHRDNQTYEVAYSTNSLIKLQDIVMSKDEYVKDTRYLNKIGKYFKDTIIKKQDKDIRKWFSCRYSDYLLFNNVNKIDTKIISIARESNNIVNFNTTKKRLKKITLSKDIILNLVVEYDRYIVDKTIIHNIELINSLTKQKQYVNFKLLLDKVQFSTIIKELYYNYLHTTNNYLIIEDNIILTLSIKDILRNIKSKYKKIIVLYILNIFKRQNRVNTNTSINRQVPTSLLIPYLYKEDFKDIDRLSKELLRYYKNITYSLLTRNMDDTISVLTYRNSNLKQKYNNRDSKTLEDIYTILSTSINLKKYGYITIPEVVSCLKELNTKRKLNNQPSIEISNGIENFVRRHLKKDAQLISDLSKIGIKYVPLNNHTISSILSYQKEYRNYSLYAKKRVIVLSKLYKR